MIKLGNEQQFYMLLEAQGRVAHKAAEAFLTLVNDFDNIAAHAMAIAKIEHEGDELTRELQRRIATTFITPLDKEDLRDLSQALDDVTDYIEAAVARAQLYKLSGPRADLAPLAGLLVKISIVVEEAVMELREGLSKSKVLPEKLELIHEIENQSDHAFRTALAHLFDEEPTDVLMVIKWKEIFDRVETAVDKCEDIAKILGTILVKYA